ncbi:MAG: formate transporter FocA [Gemmataceae bacterium]|nr:formate transporter FocA [Gemmataceae bacterium]
MNQPSEPRLDAPALDALLPAEIARKAEDIGVKKANLGAMNTLVLAVLAGAFIALGGVFATTVSAGAAGYLPFGVTRLLAGLVFSLGLILVVVGGAELFTGNNLIVMAWANGRVSGVRLLRNWALVYLGNLAGATATAALVFAGGQYKFGGGAVGNAALAIGDAKVQFSFLEGVALGILCNGLVCLAVWLSYGGRSTTDKIVAIVPPIAAFVAAGFEHSIANMYFLPLALFVRAGADDSFWTAIGKSPADYRDLTWSNAIVGNLVPVTLGNIIGGVGLVGLVYWFVYLRNRK